ncbi:MAG: ABC transporter permease [Candidatus Omnitrophica bacterium]|nr:ABC transporter permease [Candidatus Omnitrophota bacterium]
MLNFLVNSDRIMVRFLRYVGQVSLLFCHTLYWTFTSSFHSKRFFNQAKIVGVESFFIAVFVGFFIGVIMALQMAYQMMQLSAEIYIPNVVAVSITRELAPVLTALIVAGRIGAGMTAEIGSMKVTEQVDALTAFAVNPVKFLVVPRFLALTLMLPVLTIFADLFGILGGFIICVFKLGITAPMFVNMVTEALVVKDIMTGLIKSVFFGMTIAMVGCHQGLSVRGGAEGVGRATTISVVTSFIMIIIMDCLFTVMFFFVFHA